MLNKQYMINIKLMQDGRRILQRNDKGIDQQQKLERAIMKIIKEETQMLKQTVTRILKDTKELKGIMKNY